MGLGDGVAPAHELLGLVLAEVASTEAHEPRHEDQICRFQRALGRAAPRHVGGRARDRRNRVGPRLGGEVVPHVHRDHDVRQAGLLYHVGRDVVQDGPVHQDLLAELHRRDQAGDGHRRAERAREPAGAEHDEGGGAQVGGDAAERRRQAVEVQSGRVRRGDAVEQQVDLRAGAQPAGQCESVPEAELQPRGKRPGVFLAPEALLEERGVRRKDGGPAERGDPGPDLAGRHARGERAADQAAHAGAADHVDRDAMLLEPLQHSDVRQAERAAAAQRQADPDPRRGLRRARKGRQRAEHNDEKGDWARQEAAATLGWSVHLGRV